MAGVAADLPKWQEYFFRLTTKLWAVEYRYTTREQNMIALAFFGLIGYCVSVRVYDYLHGHGELF